MTQQPSRSGPDPIGDFQRWLVRSGTRSVSREVSGHLRSVLGRGDGPADVWDSATRPAEQEAPECAWCPLCRAARVLRESGPGVSAQVAMATDVLTGLVQDAMSAVESALAAGGRMTRPDTGGAPGSSWDRADPGSPWDQASSGVAGDDADSAATAWDEAVSTAVPPAAGPAADGGQPGPRPGGADQHPGDEPEPTGAPGGPQHEPDDRG
jgi:hypothetical protein